MSDEPETWRERICTDPEVMDGQPVVRGSRATVGYILELLADKPDAGPAAAELRNVERADVLAAVGFAAHVMREHPEITRRLAQTSDTQA